MRNLVVAWLCLLGCLSLGFALQISGGSEPSNEISSISDWPSSMKSADDQKEPQQQQESFKKVHHSDDTNNNSIASVISQLPQSIHTHNQTQTPIHANESQLQSNENNNKTGDSLMRNKKNKKKRKQAQNLKLLRTNNGQCEYIKRPWQECQSNGIQQRVLKLRKIRGASSFAVKNSNNKPDPFQHQNNQIKQNVTLNNNNNNNSNGAGVKCDPVRIIRRECNTGCKYLRGQWSAKCMDGQRVRIDTLIGPRWRQQHQSQAHSTSSNNQTIGAHLITCQPQRKVTKECRRTCHYIKSDWGPCINGFKRRNLNLDERPVEDLHLGAANEKDSTSSGQIPASSSGGSTSRIGVHVGREQRKSGIGCPKSKLIKRACQAKS